MEHFDELKGLLGESSTLDSLIRVSGSIARDKHRDNVIAIDRAYAGSDSFYLIAKYIGEEKFNSIVEQFSGLLALELMKAKKSKDEEIAKFDIVKH